MFGPLFDAAALPPAYLDFLPGTVCEPLSSTHHGRIVLIERGECTFVTKVQQAERAGAIGVIVFNNLPDVVPFRMSGEPQDSGIPSTLISKADVAELMDYQGTLTFQQLWGLEQEAESSELFFRMHPASTTIDPGHLSSFFTSLIIERVQDWINQNIALVFESPQAVAHLAQQDLPSPPLSQQADDDPASPLSDQDHLATAGGEILP
jgi:hypothetical protein